MAVLPKDIHPEMSNILEEATQVLQAIATRRIKALREERNKMPTAWLKQAVTAAMMNIQEWQMALEKRHDTPKSPVLGKLLVRLSTRRHWPPVTPLPILHENHDSANEHSDSDSEASAEVMPMAREPPETSSTNRGEARRIRPKQIPGCQITCDAARDK